MGRNLMRLFQPDNFSNPDIVYRPLDNKGDRAALIRAAMVYCPEREVKEIKKLDATEINSNNFRITLNDGKKKVILLRRYNILKNKPQINFYLHLIQALELKSVPVSHVLKNFNNEVLVEIEGGLYAAFDFIEANHFVPTEKGFRAVAQATAQLHSALNQLESRCGDLVKEFEKKITGVYFTIVKDYSVNDFEEIAHLISLKSVPTLLEQDLLIEFAFYKQLVSAIKARAEEARALPIKIVHSDLHPHNILMKDAEVRAIIDFDFIRMGQQARDAAMTMYRFGRQFLVDKEEPEIKVRAQNLRELFLNEYLITNPLTDKEVELMPLLLKDEFIKKILTVLKSVYQDKYFAWAKDIPKFMAALKEIEYFF